MWTNQRWRQKVCSRVLSKKGQADIEQIPRIAQAFEERKSAGRRGEEAERDKMDVRLLRVQGKMREERGMKEKIQIK